jgi:hypothetical protein
MMKQITLGALALSTMAVLASGASAASVPRLAAASAPVLGTVAPSAELQLANHTKYHYCVWSRDRWGRPYRNCWWDKRLRRRHWR